MVAAVSKLSPFSSIIPPTLPLTRRRSNSLKHEKQRKIKNQIFWMLMWFFHNIGITIFNKSALKAINLPITLTLIHLFCNSLGAYFYIFIFKAIERKALKREDKNLLFYFSFIFVLNIITGNWSLSLVSISLNQVMRALVPGVTLYLSIFLLKKSFSLTKKLALIPVIVGVMITCKGTNTFTTLGLISTTFAVCFAALKSVLSSKFLTGDLTLHPIDLILYQAPLSCFWCFLLFLFTKEYLVLYEKLDIILPQFYLFLLTGVFSFSMNITSFFANQATSPVSLAVCSNIKQIVLILLSIYIYDDVITTQKGIGILIVVCGGIFYTYISMKENLR